MLEPGFGRQQLFPRTNYQASGFHLPLDFRRYEFVVC